MLKRFVWISHTGVSSEGITLKIRTPPPVCESDTGCRPSSTTSKSGAFFAGLEFRSHQGYRVAFECCRALSFHLSVILAMRQDRLQASDRRSFHRRMPRPFHRQASCVLCRGNIAGPKQCAVRLETRAQNVDECGYIIAGEHDLLWRRDMPHKCREHLGHCGWLGAHLLRESAQSFLC